MSTPSPRDIPILSDALIAEAMRRACAERFPDDPHRCQVFPLADVEALATLNPSGCCAIGWITSGWYQACFDVWLHVDDGRLAYYRVDRLTKRDPETVAFRQRVTKRAIAAALERAREAFGSDAEVRVQGVYGRPWEETVNSLQGATASSDRSSAGSREAAIVTACRSGSTCTLARSPMASGGAAIRSRGWNDAHPTSTLAGRPPLHRGIIADGFTISNGSG